MSIAENNEFQDDIPTKQETNLQASKRLLILEILDLQERIDPGLTHQSRNHKYFFQAGLSHLSNLPVEELERVRSILMKRLSKLLLKVVLEIEPVMHESFASQTEEYRHVCL